MSNINNEDIYNFSDTEVESESSENMKFAETASDETPDCNQAIVMPGKFKLKLNDYIRAIADLVNPKDILFASYCSGYRVCLYLRTCELANDLVVNHHDIIIKREIINIEKLVLPGPVKRLELIDIPPHIPQHVIANALSKLKITLTSPISFVPMTFNDEEDRQLFSHMLLFRRQVYYRSKQEREDIPPAMILKYMNEDYKMFLRVSRMSTVLKGTGKSSLASDASSLNNTQRGRSRATKRPTSAPGSSRVKRSKYYKLTRKAILVGPTKLHERPIYVVTPTFKRAEQNAELTMLSNTLKLVPNVIWMVIEDAPYRSRRVADRLEKSGLVYIHLNAHHNKPGYKGPAHCRNLALRWLRSYAREDGVLYFADDDNAYDIELFDEIRTTKRVSAWPVGLIGPMGVSSPILKNGLFDGFFDPFKGNRIFCMDMAGFAVSVRFLRQRPWASFVMRRGYEEDSFLRGLHPFTPEEFEFKAKNCTKILVWHTRTIENKPARPLNRIKYQDTNLIALESHIL